jgi:phosphoglucosamine mutase
LSGNTSIKNRIEEIENELGNSGRVLLRASGTEPVIRVMIEASDENKANEFAQALAQLVKSELTL